jgi:nicotinate-nucleotide adenylyltransferase
MRIGLFGGTFDPIHYAHLRVAEEVAEALRLERGLFIPAGQPPHRNHPSATAAERLAMVRLAGAGNPRFEASDLEGNRPGKSFTVDTVAELARRRPGDLFSLLLGMDQFVQLPGWHETERLLSLCRLAVFARPGVPARRKPAGRVIPRGRSIVVPVSALDISATDIRRRAARGLSLRYLLPERVAAYIRRRRLYRP